MKDWVCADDEIGPLWLVNSTGSYRHSASAVTRCSDRRKWLGNGDGDQFYISTTDSSDWPMA